MTKSGVEKLAATLVQSDARSIALPDGSAQTCVTSPPYFGLRDYGLTPSAWGGDNTCTHEWGDLIPQNSRHRYTAENSGKASVIAAASGFPIARGSFCQRCEAWFGCLGLEPTPELYVAHIVEVFREVRRCLRDDGTLWLNLGDSFAANRTRQVASTKGGAKHGKAQGTSGSMHVPEGLKPKDLIGIPWRVAFALQADGWYLRSDIIWHKPNVMPESVRDRPTKAHEYVFLLSKSAKYFYDAVAVKEPAVSTHASGNGFKRGARLSYSDDAGPRGNEKQWQPTEKRSRRSVWSINTKPFKEAHFAVMPEALVDVCVLAGSKSGDLVLDPFLGSGTVAKVALVHGRRAFGCELNPEYLKIAKARVGGAR